MPKTKNEKAEQKVEDLLRSTLAMLRSHAGKPAVRKAAELWESRLTLAKKMSNA